MISGSFYHEDCHGHRGKINPGDVQWMTAGRGIIHSEMPASDKEDSLGFQLWLNLRAKDKMSPASYQEFVADKFPVYKDDTLTTKIIAGEFRGQVSPINLKTRALYLDSQLQPRAAQ